MTKSSLKSQSTGDLEETLALLVAELKTRYGQSQEELDRKREHLNSLLTDLVPVVAHRKKPGVKYELRKDGQVFQWSGRGRISSAIGRYLAENPTAKLEDLLLKRCEQIPKVQK